MAKTSKGNSKGKGFQKRKNKFSSKSEEKGNPKNTNYEEDQFRCADNDITWYSKNKQLLFDSANINYPYPVGSRMSLSYYDERAQQMSDKPLNYYLPGIMQIGWRPSVGVSSDEASAVNIAARNVYSFIRQANSGAKNYDSTDLMLYLLAMDSCYAYHAFLIRIYGVLRNTQPTVRYMPESLTAVCGGDYADLTSHLADLRYYINFYGARLGAMAVPDNMYYFTRHRWMSSNVYADEPSAKPQFYVFVPTGLMQFGYDADGAGMLSYKDLGFMRWVDTGVPGSAKGLTFEEIRNYGESLLSPILGDEDFNIMSGDILKAYGSHIVAIPTITEDYMTGFTYSPEVLEQIHNLQCYHTLWDDESWVIKQDAKKSHLIFEPWCNGAPFMPEVFIDSRSDLPTPEDTMILTRLISFIDTPKTGAKFMLSTAGSEVVTAVCEYQFKADVSDEGTIAGPLAGRNLWTINLVPSDFVAAEGKVTVGPWVWNEIMNGLGTGSSDRAPLRTWIVDTTHLTATPGTYEQVRALRVTGQKNNLTKVSRDSIDRMHQTALLSLFNVPALGNSK